MGDAVMPAGDDIATLFLDGARRRARLSGSEARCVRTSMARIWAMWRSTVGLVEAGAGEERRAVVGVEQGEEDVLGADVVVPEAQRLAERQLEHLLRRLAVRAPGRRSPRRPAAGPPWRRRAPRRASRPNAVIASAARPCASLATPMRQVGRQDLGVPAAWAAESCAAITAFLARGVKRAKPSSSPGSRRQEALARGLLGDAHRPADVGPRRAGATGLVDEVADEVVGQVAEVVGGDHRAGQLLQLVVVDLADGRRSGRRGGSWSAARRRSCDNLRLSTARSTTSGCRRLPGRRGERQAVDQRLGVRGQARSLPVGPQHARAAHPWRQLDLHAALPWHVDRVGRRAARAARGGSPRGR